MAKKIWIGAAVVIGLAIVSGGIWIGTKIWQSLTAPKLTLEQNLTDDGSFMESFLYSGDLRYVSTAIEYSLTPTKPFTLGRQIGNIMGDLHLYAIPGNKDYAVLTGFMFPEQVFRNESTEPIDFSSLKIDKIVFFGEQDGSFIEKSSRDSSLAAELAEWLNHPIDRLPENSVNLGMIRFYSDSLPGLYMYLYIQQSPDSGMYYSFPNDQEDGIKTGPLFIEWITVK